MTDALSTGWADVEASILADSAAGLEIFPVGLVEVTA